MQSDSAASLGIGSQQCGFYAKPNGGSISSDLCNALEALEALKRSGDSKAFESNRPIVESLVWVFAGIALWIGLAWLL